MTKIEKVSREEIERLISSGEWGTLDDTQRARLASSLSATTKFWVGLVNNDLICAFGIATPTLISNRAYFWVWTTEKLKDHLFIFTRRSQIVVKTLLEEVDALYGYCDTSIPGSQRWLKWLGAEFEEPEGEMIPFEIRRA